MACTLPQSIPTFEILSYECDAVALKILFTQYFEESSEEIDHAIKALRYQNHDYRERILYGLKVPPSNCHTVKPTDTLVAAAIAVPHKVAQNKVLEIVWFATSNNCKNQGHGTNLFNFVVASAKLNNFAAVLVTSTNRATPWWVSRLDVAADEVARKVDGNAEKFHSQAASNKFAALSKYIFRSSARPKLDAIALSKDVLEDDKFGTILEEKLTKYDISIEPFPTHYLLAGLYADRVERNRKGKLSKVQNFNGLPYRYGVAQSNHIWFLLSKHLIKSVGVTSDKKLNGIVNATTTRLTC